MSRQLAVINPQFGDLSPTDDSRRSVQRALGKADRRLLTDAIQQFAAYVDPAGEASSRPGMAYNTVSTSVSAYVGRLLANDEVARYLERNHLDMKRELEGIIAAIRTD